MRRFGLPVSTIIFLLSSDAVLSRMNDLALAIEVIQVEIID
jgi:hypothetical protein